MTGRFLHLFAFVVLLALLLPVAAAAQTISLTPSHPKSWDASVNIGWLGGNKDDIAERWNNWYDTFATSVDVGRYWTPHFKTELGGTFTTEGDVYTQEAFAVPGQPFPAIVSREHRYELNALNLSAAYQLFENTWVHPFVAGGVQLAWERHRVETPFPVFGRDGRPLPAPPAPDSADTAFDAQPFLSGGAKFYVNERGFIRTDVTTAFDRGGAARASWRVGGGIDF